MSHYIRQHDYLFALFALYPTIDRLYDYIFVIVLDLKFVLFSFFIIVVVVVVVVVEKSNNEKLKLKPWKNIIYVDTK